MRFLLDWHKMESCDHQFKVEYVAPEKPVKPTKDDWTNGEERSDAKKVYAKKLSAYKNKLRPIPNIISSAQQHGEQVFNGAGVM